MVAKMLAVVSCALVLAACPPPPPPAAPEFQIQSLAQQIQLSPCDSVPPPPVAVQALTGGDTYENEVHDCQRLVLSTFAGDAFGPLVGIFPLDSAMRLPAQGFAGGRIAASIYSWGTIDNQLQGYPALQIEPGWQCLWLRYERETWAAAVTPVGQAPCQSPGLHPDPNYAFLEVRQLVHESAEAADPGFYPPTARWAWDSSQSKHYIGIKCGTGWCVIGERGFTPRESQPLRGAKERSVPGWYDEQHLAIPDPANPAVLRPGPWGTIYPISDLASITPARFARGLVVAYMDIVEEPRHPGGLAYYTQKFYLETAGTIGEGSIALSVTGQTSGTAEFVQKNSGRRRATTGFRRLPDIAHAAPGAVRWRWREGDESAWVWCRGCCDAF
jgi:hypothetical protein